MDKTCFGCRNYSPGLKDISRGQCIDLMIPVRSDYGGDCPYHRPWGIGKAVKNEKVSI